MPRPDDIRQQLRPHVRAPLRDDGDIDGNGTVDADDLTIFANNFGRRIESASGSVTAPA